MAKISQASSKYIIQATIEIDGMVDRPDVVGAIFGQIEGLLGADLELRELQRSGRIGRIEVDVKSKDGKTTGSITIPSSLDKAETAIVGGALEIIERIGPCEAKIQVTNIHDERIAKRQAVINRAKQLLKNLNDSVLPDSDEITGEVSTSVRVAEIQKYGKDKLAAGPDIDESEEIIIVEGRADVVNLLKHGFKNVISLNGARVPDTIKQLCKQKEVTLFCDGDRGGDMIIKAMLSTTDVDYVTKAPDGKEVEELQKKEIHQAIRGRVKANEWGKKGSSRNSRNSRNSNKKNSRKSDNKRSNDRRSNKRGRDNKTNSRTPRVSPAQKEALSELYAQVKGKRKALIVNNDNKVLGQIAPKDLAETLPNLDKVGAVLFGSKISKDAAEALDKNRVRVIIAKDAPEDMRAAYMKPEDL